MSQVLTEPWILLSMHKLTKQNKAASSLTTTDEQLGKNYYEYTARGWPTKFGWENMTKGTQYLWVQRALKARKEYNTS